MLVLANPNPNLTCGELVGGAEEARAELAHEDVAAREQHRIHHAEQRIAVGLPHLLRARAKVRVRARARVRVRARARVRVRVRSGASRRVCRTWRGSVARRLMRTSSTSVEIGEI